MTVSSRRRLFIAPIEFDRVAVGFYLNRSDDPNASVDNPVSFAASRFIGIGEEVSANYTTYSWLAANHIRDWKEQPSGAR
jgi:hypothetical protein